MNRDKKAGMPRRKKNKKDTKPENGWPAIPGVGTGADPHGGRPRPSASRSKSKPPAASVRHLGNNCDANIIVIDSDDDDDVTVLGDVQVNRKPPKVEAAACAASPQPSQAVYHQQMQQPCPPLQQQSARQENFLQWGPRSPGSPQLKPRPLLQQACPQGHQPTRGGPFTGQQQPVPLFPNVHAGPSPMQQRAEQPGWSVSRGMPRPLQPPNRAVRLPQPLLSPQGNRALAPPPGPGPGPGPGSGSGPGLRHGGMVPNRPSHTGPLSAYPDHQHHQQAMVPLQAAARPLPQADPTPLGSKHERVDGAYGTDGGRGCVSDSNAATLESFPNNGVDPSRESILPVHSAFRQEMKAEPRPPSVGKITFGKQEVSRDSVIARINAEVEAAIKKLSGRGKFVPEGVVINITNDLLRKTRMPNGPALRWFNIDFANNFSKLHGRMKELVHVYCQFTPITTLHDLQAAIAQVEKVDDYEDLCMGPIVKHPIVKDLFKPPDDIRKPPEISLFQLYKYVMRMTERKKSRDRKFSLEEYLEFVRAKEGLETIQHLCIRIRSFPLLIQIKSKYGGMMRDRQVQMFAKLQQEMESQLSHEVGLLKRKFSDPRNDDPLSIMRDMAGKDPVIILSTVFETCMHYLGPFQKGKLADFVQFFLKNKALRDMFLLAIYKGAYSADRLFPKFFEDDGASSMSYGSGGGGGAGLMMGGGASSAVYKPEGEVVSELCQLLKAIPSPVTLSNLVKVERYMAQMSGAGYFSSLGCGSFLSLLTAHQELLVQVGGGVVGMAGSPGARVEVRKARMMGVVHQLERCLKDREDVVEHAVVKQLGVEDFLDLGCGQAQKLVSEYGTLQESGGLPQENPFTYLTPLLLNSCQSSAPTTASHSGDVLGNMQHSVGVLGHKSRSDALRCLEAAPLLEDLGEWSHWPVVYQPQLGPLPEFLLGLGRSDFDGAGVAVLEVPPGKLLKIDSKSSIQAFNLAMSDMDHVGTTGHLVSLVALRGNTRDISPQLLSGHVTSVLQKVMARDEVGGVADSDEEMGKEGVVAEFVWKCLQRIPLELCKLLAREIFLDPLCKVTSVSVMEGILSLCAMPTQRRFLQELGMCVGVRKWTEDVTTMWEDPVEERRKRIREGEVGSQAVEGQLAMELEPSAVASAPVPSSTRPDQQPRSELDLLASSTDGNDDPLHTDEHSFDPGPSLANDLQQLSKEDLADLEKKCFEVVQSIRHEEFGIGVELDSKQQMVASKQREREGRGIKRLSLELYSKDTHFVLELIQNADDNSYSPALHQGSSSLTGKGSQGSQELLVPSLKFILRKKEIIVLNNEVGFSEKNVRAICDVGRSTKSASRSGYIGQKGIGFKSVFRISDMPAIHSNGYHIAFDASSDPIGFILPHWCLRDEEEAGKDVEWRSWTTRIELPLKEEQASKDMAKKFDDVQPSLLLFLHRLRSISVADEVTDRVRYMFRYDLGQGIVEIRHGNTTMLSTDQWLVVKKVLEDASKYKSEVEATELALAFPLPQNQDRSIQSKDLQQQQVFAFLPLRSYGFRFIVQGDFDLPSSRECVTSDSSWNQWLREQIPNLFLQALRVMREHFGRVDQETEVDAVALFLQFVPLEGEVLDFFQPLTSQILGLIRGSKCLPTEPDSRQASSAVTFSSLVSPSSTASSVGAGRDGSSGTMEWKQPAQCLYVRDEFIHDHIPQDLLVEALGLHYLHPAVLDSLNPSLRNQLGIKSLSLEHLKEVARVLLSYYETSSSSGEETEEDDDHMMISDDEDCDDDCIITGVTGGHSGKFTESTRQLMVDWIAGWLACIHIIIEETSALGRSDLLDKIKDLKILPLEDGTFAAAKEGGTIFFPPDFKAGGDGDSKSDNFEDIYKEMKVLDMSLFNGSDDLTQSRLRKVLELLGVKSLYPVHILTHHIIPRFKTVENQKTLVRYLQYFKEFSGRRDSGISENEFIPMLKKCVVLVTNDGLKTPDTEVIHFSSNYFTSGENLVGMFPDVKWTTVSPKYLPKKAGMEEKSSWVRLFERMGIRRHLVVEKTFVELKKGSPEWQELCDSVMKRLPNTSYFLRDYRSVEVEKIVASVSDKSPNIQQQKMSVLAELLDSKWERQHQNEMEAHIYDSKNEEYLEARTASSFSKFLVHQAWLPSVFAGNMSESSRAYSQVLWRGCDLFCNKSQEVRRLLHVHVPYVGANLQSAEFKKHLQIQDSVSRKKILEHLKSWSSASQEEDDESFTTSIDHMSAVYDFLLGQARSDEIESIQEEFTGDGDPLLFVPNEYSMDNSRSTVDLPGKFLPVHSVCWMDPTGILHDFQKFNWKLPGNLPKVLSLHYNYDTALKKAFESVNVRTCPTIVSMFSLLKFNSSQSATPDKDTLSNFTGISLFIVDVCIEQGLKGSYIRDNLKNSKVFPSSKRCWVSPDEMCLFENDDPDRAKYFADSNGIHFLQWPSQMTSGRKSEKFKSQYTLNNERKQNFLNHFQIPLFSGEVKVRTDFQMISPLEEMKEKLSIYIPLIQCFLLQNCREHYACLENELGIADQLKSLQVFVAEDLKILYYIEYGDATVNSSKAKKEVCSLSVEDGKPVIYISEKKKDKPPSFLFDPIFELFMKGCLNGKEKDKFSDFLGYLFRCLPSTAEDLEEICEKYSLELDRVIEKWFIPIKQQLLKEMSVEEDYDQTIVTNSVAITDGAITCAPTAPSDGKNAEVSQLTSWPPRAAVDPTASSGSRKIQTSYNLSGSSKLNSQDVIGRDDLMEVMKDYTGGEEDGEKSQTSQGAMTKAVERNLGENAHFQKGGNSKIDGQGQNGRAPASFEHSDMPRDSSFVGGFPSSESARDDTKGARGSGLSDGSKDNAGLQEGHLDRRSPEHSLSHDGSHSKLKSSSWQAAVSPRKDISSQVVCSVVDIQGFVDQIGQTVDFPALELVEQEKDAESLLKISRWGEEYVFSVLKARMELPNGRKIVDLSWINQEEETGFPFDIIVSLAEDNESEVVMGEGELASRSQESISTHKIYIEVKSTAAKEKAMFEISPNEIKFSEQKRGNYHVYIVYSAGLQCSRLFQLENLNLYLRQNSGKLMLII